MRTASQFKSILNLWYTTRRNKIFIEVVFIIFLLRKDMAVWTFYHSFHIRHTI